MDISDTGIEFIRRWEGCNPCAYRDAAGHLTIGVGHLLTRSERSSGKIHIAGTPVRWAHDLSERQIDDLLHQDLAPVAATLAEHVHVPLTQNEYDALCSFAFNAGCDAFRRSTLLRRLNFGDYPCVPAELARWVYAGGRVLAGLERRRAAEAKLFTLRAAS